MTKYFTSDTHFGHPFVAALRGYAKDGFASDDTIRRQANQNHLPLKDCVDWYRHDSDVTDHIDGMVGETDELYVLGDLSSGNTWSLDQALMRVKSLRCPRRNRHLILGNHDDALYGKSHGFGELAEAFGEVGRIGMTDITDGDTVMTVFLCHFQWRGDFDLDACEGVAANWAKPGLRRYAIPQVGADMRLLHGHTHAATPHEFANRNEINVGLDAWGMHPVSEAELVRMFREDGRN